MPKSCKWIFAIILILPMAFAAGCDSRFGWVDQGRVIEYDKDQGTVTFIRDVSTDSKNPDYSHLPPVTYKLPADPHEMGPAPKAGKRMKLDLKNKQIVVYVPALNSFATINYTLIDQKENIGSQDPLVYDASTDSAIKFPIVDKFKKTITIYSKRQKTLTSFSVPDEYFALTDDTWDNGDEVRVYYKEKGIAKRFMNISKTDIFKK
ncbi:MAG: DUF4881 domain-containing protein [Syntrophobacteraceae bacterium]